MSPIELFWTAKKIFTIVIGLEGSSGNKATNFQGDPDSAKNLAIKTSTENWRTISDTIKTHFKWEAEEIY